MSKIGDEGRREERKKGEGMEIDFKKTRNAWKELLNSKADEKPEVE